MNDHPVGETALLSRKYLPTSREFGSMRDNRIQLDGTWEFLHLVEDYRSRPVDWRHITVPGPWQAQFPDLRMRGGTGIYRRRFEIPRGWKRERQFIRFGAVFHIARVWINGEYLGMHVGGFLPFSFELTEHLFEGRNELKVQVDSPVDDPNEFPDTPFAEIPFGKQSWYGPLSGIWQSVWIERRVADHLGRTRITPDWETGQVAIRVFPAEPALSEARLRLSVFGPDGEPVVAAEALLPSGGNEAELVVAVPDRRSWSPETPDLYTARIALERDGVTVDAIEEHFGFRRIETRDGRFYLNGEPLYLRAALDQDYYPDTICTTPSTAFLEDEFRKAKELGLNCLRCHIKAPDPRYYEVPDRMGLLVWTELPNMGFLTERSGDRKLATLKGIVDRDGNHPSIICWTIINENWGVDLVHDPDHRNWLKQAFQWLKSYDPTRLVVDNSPLAPSFHVETDIADYHFYAAIPDHREDWDKFVDGLARRASWLYSPHGDAVISGREPLMCSEFGNWGLPYPDDLRDETGGEPWWFETGHDWGDGVMYAHGVENRFTDWSLDRVFGDLRRFVAAAQWQQFRALKYQIEAMRRKPTLAGYVITELHDCHWESNGLLDMRRNPRAFHEQFHIVNADTVIVPKWEHLSYWSGETARFEVTIAHGAGAEIEEGSQLEIRLGEDVRRIPLPRLEAPKLLPMGEMEVRVPQMREAGPRRVELELRSPTGALIAENHLELAVHPERAAPRHGQERVWSPSREIMARLRTLGYDTAARLEEASLVVSKTHTEAVAAHVRGGACLILLPDAEGPLYP